ncbi:MAG: hypothetical protein V9E88_01065 [Ferruginibacter sp.]
MNIIICSCFAFLHFLSAVFPIQDSAIAISLHFNSTNLTQYEDARININFKNSGKEYVLIPDVLNFGYLDRHLRDTFCSVLWDVEKKDIKMFKKYRSDAHLCPVPILITYDTLYMNETITRKFPLAAYYKFEKGEYRVRAFYRLNKSDRLINSEWIYFKVLKEISF